MVDPTKINARNDKNQSNNLQGSGYFPQLSANKSEARFVLSFIFYHSHLNFANFVEIPCFQSF